LNIEVKRGASNHLWAAWPICTSGVTTASSEAKYKPTYPTEESAVGKCPARRGGGSCLGWDIRIVEKKKKEGLFQGENLHGSAFLIWNTSSQ
jgi:hypothetical protein